MKHGLFGEDIRKVRPVKPWSPDDGGDKDSGPQRPKVGRPDTEELLKKMRRVDPDKVRRFPRQPGQ